MRVPGIGKALKAMLRTTAKRYVKRSVLATLQRLPQSVQLRLCCELAVILGDQAAKVAPVFLARMPAADRVLPVQEEAEKAQGVGLDFCTRILMTLPVGERGNFLRDLMAQADAKPADVLMSLFNDLPRLENVSIFQRLASILEVSAVEVCGANGRLTGYLRDEGVFLPYVRDRAWFWNAVEFINSIFVGRAGGTFLDIGANIGAVVVPIARANPSVDCFAFEPEPNNYLALMHNIARNQVANNVEAYQMALADTDGAVTFELSDSNFGDHRVRKAVRRVDAPVFGETGRATIEVGARRLDRVLIADELVRPIVGKIDVQGAEQMVLAGGEAVLREADLLIVEYWPYGMRRLGTDPAAFLNGFSKMFPFVTRLGEQPIAQSDFVPWAAMRADLDAFAEKRTWMHLNLALCKRRPTEFARAR